MCCSCPQFESNLPSLVFYNINNKIIIPNFGVSYLFLINWLGLTICFFFFLHFILFDIIPFITILIDISLFFITSTYIIFCISLLFFYFLSLNLDQFTLFYMCINCFIFFLDMTKSIISNDSLSS